MIVKELIKKRKDLWEQYKDIEEDKEFNRYVAMLWNDEGPYKGKYIGKEMTEEIRKQPFLLIELFFRLTNKDFVTVPFFYNEVQTDFMEKHFCVDYEKQRKREMDSIKYIVLKGRQQGFSTLITAIQLSFSMVEHGFRGFTMAHDTDSTSSIFSDIAKNMYDNLIDEVKENPKRSNAKELVLESNDSAWRIATAGSKGAGRGKKLRMLHSSEQAFWENMEVNKAAIGQALAKHSIEIVETTANGYNLFKEAWDLAQEGNSNYKAFFYEWFKTSEYQREFRGLDYTEYDFLRAVELGERFKGVDSEFMKFLGTMKDKLTLEQLHWYFSKRQELKAKVYQEYPCFPEQAFLHSGTPYFDIELLDYQINEMKDLNNFKMLKGGDVEVYHEPVKNRKYCIGSDVAEGLEDRDSSTFFILDLETMEEVANGEYIEKPENHARILHEWAKKYNNAFIAVERNNHGHSTLNTLDNELGYRRNLYIEKTVDKIRNTTVEKLGWSTNGKSKYIMLDKIDQAHREEKIKINSVRTLKQMRTIQTENGKVETNGKDRVIAVAIAYAVHEEARRRLGNFTGVRMTGY